jgi:RNA recognition motif-containing protein
MENKLFVGSLAWATNDESLMEAFSAAGEVVSANVITDRETGRSRGFGFVEMATPEDAQAAIEMWNEKDLDGRSIRVSIAKPRDDRE